jgi:hydrogenase nickel incorporation protein HypA/HybF
MHEFSIIQGIVDIALDAAGNHHVKKVSAVEVEVGDASGVVHEALELAWEAATRDTMLNGALLKIKQIPLTAVCRKCGHRFCPKEIYDGCPDCGEFHAEIVKGKELRVVAVLIDED